MPRFLQQLKELWAETTGRPVSCRVPLPGVFLRTPVSSGATHPAQLLLLPLRLVSHIPGATSLGSATPFLIPPPSFLAQLPPVTGPRSSVAAQSMHRPETNFQKGVGAARTGKLQIGGTPCSGCPLPAQRVLSQSGLLPCVWAWPTTGPQLLATKTLTKAQPTPAQPPWSREGDVRFLPPSPRHQLLSLVTWITFCANSSPHADSHSQLQTEQLPPG